MGWTKGTAGSISGLLAPPCTGQHLCVKQLCWEASGLFSLIVFINPEWNSCLTLCVWSSRCGQCLVLHSLSAWAHSRAAWSVVDDVHTALPWSAATQLHTAHLWLSPLLGVGLSLVSSHLRVSLSLPLIIFSLDTHTWNPVISYRSQALWERPFLLEFRKWSWLWRRDSVNVQFTSEPSSNPGERQ